MASPTDITGLVHRFRASQLTGLTDGSNVANASFELGGVTLSQATTSAQPKYISNGINSQPCLRFNGTSSFITSGTVSLSQSFTVSVVIKISSSTGTQQIIDGAVQFLFNYTAGLYTFYAGNTVSGGNVSVGAHVLTALAANGTSTLYVDGVAVATSTSGTNALNKYGLGSQGSSQFFNGEIYEINTYNKLLSSTERATYGRYVQDTYAISVADAAATTASSSRFVRSSDLVSIVLANVKAPKSSAKTSSYTLALRDMGTIIEMNSPNSNTVTIPPNSSIAFPLGSIVTVVQTGAGRTNIVAGSGVTIDTPNGTALYTRYGPVTLRQRAINEWVLTGALSEFSDMSGFNGIVYRLRASKLGYTVDGTSVASVSPEVGSTVLSQPTAAYQPKWYSAGKNGKPFIRFDGVDDYLFNSTSIGYSQPFIIAMAAQLYDSNGPKELVKIGGLEMIANTGQNGGSLWSLYSGSTTDSIYRPGGVTTFTAYFGKGGTGNGVAYTNNTLTSSNSTGNNVTNGDFYVGTHTSIARFANMDLYELMMFNAALTDADIQYINRYLRSYYQ